MQAPNVIHERAFLSKDECRQLWRHFESEIVWYRVKYHSRRFNSWCETPCYTNCFGGIPGETHYQPLPGFLKTLKEELEAKLQCSFNVCLVRLYLDGKDNVAWHTDAREFLGDETTVASVSLGAARRFDMKAVKELWPAIGREEHHYVRGRQVACGKRHQGCQCCCEHSHVVTCLKRSRPKVFGPSTDDYICTKDAAQLHQSKSGRPKEHQPAAGYESCSSHVPEKSTSSFELTKQQQQGIQYSQQQQRLQPQQLWNSDRKNSQARKAPGFATSQPCHASVMAPIASVVTPSHNLQQQVLHWTLEAGDLFVMQGNTQKHFVHRVPQQKEVHKPRININFRYILPDIPAASKGHETYYKYCVYGDEPTQYKSFGKSLGCILKEKMEAYRPPKSRSISDFFALHANNSLPQKQSIK